MYKGREAQEKARYEARKAQREQDMWDARAPREPYKRGLLNLADSIMYYGSFDVNMALFEKAPNNLK